MAKTKRMDIKCNGEPWGGGWQISAGATRISYKRFKLVTSIDENEMVTIHHNGRKLLEISADDLGDATCLLALKEPE